jgi:protein O-GlcNAc transferase
MTIDEALELAFDHHKAGRLAEAEAIYRRILDADPDQPAANYCLGILAGQTGHVEAGLPYLKAAIRARDDAPAYHAGLGHALTALGRIEEALACYQRVVALRPDWPQAYTNLAECHSTLDQPNAAVECYEKAVALDPDYAEAHSNMGGVLRDVGRLEDSLAHCERAIDLCPDMAAAHYNMAFTNLSIGHHDRSLAGYRRALELTPDLIRAHTSILTTILYHSGWTPEMLFAEHRRFENMHALRHYPAKVNFANSREPDRRLRIGFLSGDLWAHPVGRNLIPMIEAHDRTRIELFFYANVLNPDRMTERFHRQAAGWRSILNVDDDAAAEMIRADRIDILVSLAGRFDLNRPLICARRPAPVQISFHDPATSGMEVMDAIIADRVLVPRHGAERFTERPIRLPSFYLHNPIDEAPPPSPPPILRNGYPTFGSCNNPAKLTTATLELWAMVMRRLPNARLKLRYKNWFLSPAIRERVLGVMTANGIAPERIELLDKAEGAYSHLSLYNEFDIALDSMPFTGSTTTFEALWMGVPVVTLPGQTMVSRWTASILAPLGLRDLVADSPESFAAICERLCSEPETLMALRVGLRDRITASPLCDAPLRARQMERTYRALWRQWCKRHDD